MTNLPRLRSLQVASPSERQKQRSNGRPFTLASLEINNLPSLTGFSLPLVHHVSIDDAPKLADLRLSVGSNLLPEVVETTDENCRLQRLPSLKRLQIDLNGERLPSSLGNLDALQSLSVTNAQRSETDQRPFRVDSVARLQQLSEVVLRDVVVDQETLSALPASVRSLTIVSGRFTSNALLGLRNLRDLTSLEIVDIRLADALLVPSPTLPSGVTPSPTPQPLPALPRLTSLSVRHSPQQPWPAHLLLGDLAGKPNLTDLVLVGVKLEIEELEAIARLKHLAVLHLSDETTPWSVAKCEALHGARSLVELGISYQGWPVVAPSEAELQRALSVDRDARTFQLQLRPVLDSQYRPASSTGRP